MLHPVMLNEAKCLRLNDRGQGQTLEVKVKYSRSR